MTTGNRIAVSASRTALACLALTAWGLPASAVSPHVTVETLDDTLTGELASLDSSRDLSLGRDNHRRLPISEVLRIEFADRTPPRGEPSEQAGEMTLVDGARLAYRACERVEEVFFLNLGDLGEAEVAAPSVRSWWLGPDRPSPEKTAIDQRVADVLWVKARRGEGVSSVEGVVLDLREEGVRFAFDGDSPSDTVLVPWARLAGIEFFHETSSAPRPACLVTLHASGQVAANAVRLEADRIVWQSEHGRGVLALSEIASIDFSSDRVTPASAMKRLGESWRPYFGSGNPGAGWAFDTSLDGAPIRLRRPDPRAPHAWPAVSIVREYKSGVSLRSQGELRFALPAQAIRLKGWIGLDPSCTRSGSADVSVLADERVVWSGVVDGTTRPADLNAGLEGARTLTLRVDYGDNLDAGDHVHFADLRVIQ
ncbi:NPCBM/NEW2 domain protein [Planctomycetes bacterium MalM25]|nr:NPCBM/NEW2 domain protein [Planctomycetes bacterium MalM25]